MKLISMTDYVLEQKRPIPSEELHEVDYYHEEYLVLERICNYANFLKQPLKLEMFVPCDENGNVLEEPQMRPERNTFDEEDMDYDAQELYDYIKAKEKVLFEGFEVEGSICFNGAKRISVDYGIFIPTMRRLTIEDLISDKKNPLQLTPTAIKQIGL